MSDFFRLHPAHPNLLVVVEVENSAENNNDITNEALNSFSTNSTRTITVTEEESEATENVVTWLIIQSPESSGSSSTNSDPQNLLLIDSDDFLVPALSIPLSTPPGIFNTIQV